MSEGCVYLVGAGPGDADLITVRGRELLGSADAVVYDALISPHLLQWARPDARRIDVGKRAGKHKLGQEQINELLVSLGRDGLTVVRLKGGDPFVFGRGGEEALALAEAGLRFEIVPGITAGIAAPAFAGIPVTHRKLASSFALITGHETPDKPDSDLDYAALANWPGTLGFYMGAANLARICDGLIANGMDAQTPAAVIRWGATARQQTVVGTVETLAKLADEAGMAAPALIVIGKVVALREQLQWFERRPLFGRRIVVTRARAQGSRMVADLTQLGAEVIESPTIRIEPPADPQPLADAVAELASFDWVVFTSVNGVDAFFAALARADLDARSLSGCKVCAIGPATSDRLVSFGIRADAQPKRFVGVEIAAMLAKLQDMKNVRVLCPRADIAPPDLIEALTATGADVYEVTAYRTVPDDACAPRVRELLERGEIHWVTFTSSSTVKNFCDQIAPKLLAGSSAKLASIGPSTSATLRERGLSPTVEADVHTIPGLIDAILH